MVDVAPILVAGGSVHPLLVTIDLHTEQRHERRQVATSEHGKLSSPGYVPRRSGPWYVSTRIQSTLFFVSLLSFLIARERERARR